MPKQQKSIRSLSIYEATINKLVTFRVTHKLPTDPIKLLSLGFSVSPTEGESIIPIPIGPYSAFNANGREIIRRDLPKTSQSRMVWSTWKDWHGNSHSGTKVLSQQVYQKDQIPPPEEYITVLQSASGPLLVSRPLNRAVDGDEKIIHVINLFLELFENIELTAVDLQPAQSLLVKRLNWRILPPGEFPFERVKNELADFLNQVKESARAVVQARIQSVTQYKPDFVAVGVGGFGDYVVFGFQARNIYVLESPTLGNATYVFKKDWAEVSALSKKEILEGALHEARLIHNKQWVFALRKAITGK